MYHSKLHWTRFLDFGIYQCISISAFASLFGTPIRITSPTVGLKVFTITAGITNYESIIKKKEEETW